MCAPARGRRPVFSMLYLPLVWPWRVPDPSVPKGVGVYRSFPPGPDVPFPRLILLPITGEFFQGFPHLGWVQQHRLAQLAGAPVLFAQGFQFHPQAQGLL